MSRTLIFILAVYSARIKYGEAGLSPPVLPKLPVAAGSPPSFPPVGLKPPTPPVIGDSTNIVGPDGEDPQKFAFNLTEIEEVIRKADEGDVSARSFAGGGLPLVDAFGRPIPGLCDLEKPFPQNCRPRRGELYGEEPPVNIPYCLRIPCLSDMKQVSLERSKRACQSHCGCYFDYELYKYRQKLGPRLYSGVPICHLAIRNKVFLEKCKLASRWSSYFTNCLINTFIEELEDERVGCAMLKVLKHFKYFPKLAGWKNIQRDECNYIGACWVAGNGCFYEMDLENLSHKSQQSATERIMAIDEAIAFGRAKCQAFDNSNPDTILRSMHMCLASGCTVDKRAWSQYNDLFWYVGNTAEPYVHHLFINAYKKGEVGPDNFQDVLNTYTTAPKAEEPRVCPNDPLTTTAATPTVSRQCPAKDRPCVPSGFGRFGPPGRYLFSPFCPYKLPPVPFPDIGPLKGVMTGCCDSPALCYLPKRQLNDQYSSVTAYYGQWAGWNDCDVTCGGGVQLRHRRCVALYKDECTEVLTQSKPCNPNPCPYWGEWSEFSPCSASCGGGKQRRSRRCFPFFIHSQCLGDKGVSRECNTHSCERMEFEGSGLM